MSMRRDTEFRWQPASGSRSRLAMSTLIGTAGLATGYMFVHVGHQQARNDSSPASTLETSMTRISPTDEPSAVAAAAPPAVALLNPHAVSPLVEPAMDEPSAVATASEREQSVPMRAVTKSRPSSSYVTLRQALLRKIR
jgi:hypothetical protein